MHTVNLVPIADVHVLEKGRWLDSPRPFKLVGWFSTIHRIPCFPIISVAKDQKLGS
jgi:hypothetical protein